MTLIGQNSDSVSGPLTNGSRSQGCLVHSPNQGPWAGLDCVSCTITTMPVAASQLQEEIDHMENFSAVLGKMTKQTRLPISAACEQYTPMVCVDVF